jgi:hypothetical protein
LVGRLQCRPDQCGTGPAAPVVRGDGEWCQREYLTAVTCRAVHQVGAAEHHKADHLLAGAGDGGEIGAVARRAADRGNHPVHARLVRERPSHDTRDGLSIVGPLGLDHHVVDRR